MKKIDEQIEECRKHVKHYIQDEEDTKELREMCKNCEAYCGKEHNYEECKDKPCFKFWLSYEYLGWVNSWVVWKMNVSKEIASKAERYEELKKELDTLYEELEEFAYANGFEDFCVNGFGVSQEPNGEEQTDGEYCDQWMMWEDSGDGIYYYPIEGSTQYFWVAYSF